MKHKEPVISNVIRFSKIHFQVEQIDKILVL